MSSEKISSNLELVLATSSALIVMVDHELGIIDSNENFNALVGTPTSFRELTDDSQLEEIENAIKRTFSQTSEKAVFTTSFESYKGIKMWIEWCAKADATKCVLVGKDRTQYYRSVEELTGLQQQFSDKKKREDLFVAKMNHELRTPLNAIIGYSQILLRSGLGEADIDHAQRIRHNGKKLLQQIDNVLSIADAEPKMKIEKVDLFPLLQSVVDEFEFTLSEVELNVEIEDRRTIDPIDADYSCLRHVIRNLLDNAIKFSTSGSIKFVVQSVESESTALHIVDEGVGISTDKVDEIFAPFQKGALLVNDCGVGLGLSVAKKLCSQMGFELVLKPSSVGSKFTILLKSN